MRIKTLGIVLISALSLFTAFYWLTDPARREGEYQNQIKELVAYGEEMFGDVTPGNDHTANCAGCHGPDGRGGAAIALANQVYLAIANDAAIRERIADGVKGTSMPAFAQASGGPLTSKQIDVIVNDDHCQRGGWHVTVVRTSEEYGNDTCDGNWV